MTVEINDLKELRERGQFDIRMSLLKNQCLIFRVEVLTAAYKSTQLSSKYHLLQEVKIVVRNNYPAHPPRVYFIGNVMTIGLIRIWTKLEFSLSETTSPKFQGNFSGQPNIRSVKSSKRFRLLFRRWSSCQRRKCISPFQLFQNTFSQTTC